VSVNFPLPDVEEVAVIIDNSPPMRGGIKIEREFTRVRLMTETTPDLKWQHVDEAGHFHAYDDDGKLPTLVKKSLHKNCDGEQCGDLDCDGYDVTWHECQLCEKEIKPGSITRYDVERQIQERYEWEVSAYKPFGVEGPPMPRDRVSIRVDTAKDTYFGIGQVRGVEGDRHGYSLRIVGASELGTRSKRRKP
jgi:hypothetical protein